MLRGLLSQGSPLRSCVRPPLCPTVTPGPRKLAGKGHSPSGPRSLSQALGTPFPSEIPTAQGAEPRGEAPLQEAPGQAGLLAPGPSAGRAPPAHRASVQGPEGPCPESSRTARPFRWNVTAVPAHLEGPAPPPGPAHLPGPGGRVGGGRWGGGRADSPLCLPGHSVGSQGNAGAERSGAEGAGAEVRTRGLARSGLLPGQLWSSYC